MTFIQLRVKDGQLRPLKRLPKSWKEGKEVRLQGDRVVTDRKQIDADFAELDRLCKKLDDPEDWKRMEQALAEHDEMAKEWMRREMGLDR